MSLNCLLFISQLTTNFLANYQLTIVFLAKYQLTANPIGTLVERYFHKNKGCQRNEM